MYMFTFKKQHNCLSANRMCGMGHVLSPHTVRSPDNPVGSSRRLLDTSAVDTGWHLSRPLVQNAGERRQQLRAVSRRS